MLTAATLDALPEPILELYRRYEDSVIQDIARRLSNLDFSSAAWQMQRLTESGLIYENALAELAKVTHMTETELLRIFTKAGVRAMKFDDSVYKAAGLSPLPLNLSPQMLQVLVAGLQKTNGIMKNLTLTTAISGQNTFINAADLAYTKISTGAFSYDDAIRQAVKDVAAQGISVVNYASDRKELLDVAMRRTVLTGVNTTVGELQLARMDELGTDLVQTSAHIGARPEHQVWQGRVFSRSGQRGKYPDFVSSTGYGTGAGLMGWNCRHSFFPFFEGISENAYKQAELDEYADKTVTYQGKTLDFYSATQQQRAIERKIRYWKRQTGALDAAGLDATFERAHLQNWQWNMRSFIKQTGIVRQRVREQI